MIKEKFNGLCINCNIKIEGKTSRARYCSTKCKSLLKRHNTNFDKQCELCNSYFTCKDKETRFCSRKCKDLNHHNIMKKEDVSLQCLWCKTEFMVKYADRGNRVVCSYSCSTRLTASKLDRDAVSKKISKSRIDGHKSGKLKSFWKGKHISEESKEKIRQTRKNNGSNKPENNPMFGKKHSKETREKISKTRSDRTIAGKYFKTLRKGIYFSSKLNKEITYRSSWEKKYYEFLDEDENVISYIVEPLRVPYIYDRKRNYIPDLLIVYITGKIFLIEIKPSCYIEAAINKAKFSAARIYCEERNMQFEVWTEKDNPYLDKEKILE